MIEGALEINNAKIIDIMTKIDKVKVLSMETRLDSYLVALIRQLGFSRVPISYSSDKKTVFGVLLAKSLVGYKIKD